MAIHQEIELPVVVAGKRTVNQRNPRKVPLTDAVHYGVIHSWPWNIAARGA
jgi:hypothetical protein